ncbi:MAG: hypothetical protein U0X87_02300 [Anaerolineales bacterium]
MLHILLNVSSLPQMLQTLDELAESANARKATQVASRDFAKQWDWATARKYGGAFHQCARCRKSVNDRPRLKERINNGLGSGTAYGVLLYSQKRGIDFEETAMIGRQSLISQKQSLGNIFQAFGLSVDKNTIGEFL